MHERLDEPLSLEDIAKIAYISPFHFNRVFHQTTGIPPFQFLYALRLETAKRLLLTTNRSVTDVCYEVGYNSLGTFTTRFTELVGLSPCRFRRLADHFPSDPLNSWLDKNEATLITTVSKHSVSGWIKSPSPSQQIIFVGLFRTCMPQGLPVAGKLLMSPGPFHVSPIPDGRYIALAAAFPNSINPLAYLAPKSEAMLVGICQSPITIRDGITISSADITLRPMRITDPPILVALPYLLENRVTA